MSLWIDCNEQWNAVCVCVCVLLNTVSVSCCVLVQYWISCCSPVHFLRCSADFVFPHTTHTHTHTCMSCESRQLPSQLNSTSNELWKAIEKELCFNSIQLGLISALSDTWATLHFTARHSDINKKNNLCSRRPLTMALQKRTSGDTLSAHILNWSLHVYDKHVLGHYSFYAWIIGFHTMFSFRD